jgi:hypothetical protein
MKPRIWAARRLPVTQSTLETKEEAMPNSAHRASATKTYRSLRSVMTTALLAGSLLLGAQAAAQTSPPTGNPPTSSQGARTPNFSDQKLSAVATAIPKIEGFDRIISSKSRKLPRRIEVALSTKRRPR